MGRRLQLQPDTRPTYEHDNSQQGLTCGARTTGSCRQQLAGGREHGLLRDTADRLGVREFLPGSLGDQSALPLRMGIAPLDRLAAQAEEHDRRRMAGGGDVDRTGVVPHNQRCPVVDRRQAAERCTPGNLGCALAAPYVAAHHGSPILVGWWLVALPVGLVGSDVAGVRLLTPRQQRRLVAPVAAAGFVPYLAFAFDPPSPSRSPAVSASVQPSRLLRSDLQRLGCCLDMRMVDLALTVSHP
jgi:hypothetical protein